MVGENIKRLRLAKNLTQSELGEAIGVAGGTIQRYESGEISPPLNRIEQIAEVLGIELVDLMAEEKSHKETFIEEFDSNFSKCSKENTLFGKYAHLGDIYMSDPGEVYKAFKEHYKKYSLKLFETFYETQYKPLIEDLRIALDISEFYRNQMSSLEIQYMDLKKEFNLKTALLDKYEKIMSSRLEEVSEKERLTNIDIQKLKLDLEFEQNMKKREEEILKREF